MTQHGPGERGQVATEYLMVAGLLVVVAIYLAQWIIPAVVAVAGAVAYSVRMIGV